jgi:hypothetical protein
VVCGALQFWDGKKREYVCQSVPRLLEKDMTITHPTCFVRTDLYERFGLYDEEYKFAMDYKLLLRLKVEGVGFVALESVLANMQHAGISEMHWRQALQETHRARVQLLNGSFFNRGGSQLIAFYRSRLALVKKTKSVCI